MNQKEKKVEKSIVDARGQNCPKPVILTKSALNKLDLSSELLILIDNETSKDNVEKFLKASGVLFQTRKKGNCFQISVSKSSDKVETNADESCTVHSENSTIGDHIIVVKNDNMGKGDDELGAVLMKGFMNTIKEVQPLPRKILFYNNGVKLTKRDSPVIDTLRELETLGLEILVCGTCVDFFKIKDEVGCGTISNMYDISESLAKASHIIAP